MRKIIFVLIGIICLYSTLLGCSDNYDRKDSNDDSLTQNTIFSIEESSLIDNATVAESENPTDNSNMINAEELSDTFGLLISLPENSTWIADDEYCLVDENNSGSIPKVALNIIYKLD